jgi:tRNA A37 threonylcarbamoyladenosine modification protein TsaB
MRPDEEFRTRRKKMYNQITVNVNTNHVERILYVIGFILFAIELTLLLK